MDLASSARMALRPAAEYSEEKLEQRKQEPQFQRRSLGSSPDKGVLESLTDVGLSGLAMAGNFLDVPGSMVRDVATWVPGGIAASNPFDQLLSPFSSKNRTQGQDLAESITGGAIDKDSWTGFGTGLALEIGLDPLTYLTLGAGAVGKGGAALRNAGFKPKDITRVANRLAKKELGDKAGRTLGNTASRQATRVRDVIENSVSDEVMANARVSAINEARRPLAEQIQAQAAKESWTDEAVEKALENLDSNPEIIKAGQRAEREVYEAGVAKKYEDFRRAGGTDEMLDEKVGGIAKFSIPFISKKFGDQYPKLRERLIGTTPLSPGEIASAKWFARPAQEAAEAARKSPVDPDDIPPGDIPPGGPDVPPDAPTTPDVPPPGPATPDVPPDPIPQAPEVARPGTPPAIDPGIDFVKFFEGARPGDALVQKYWDQLQNNGSITPLGNPEKPPLFEQLIIRANNEGLIESIDDIKPFANATSVDTAKGLLESLRKKKARPGISTQDFKKLSPKHARFSDELDKVVEAGIFDEPSAGLVREIFRDSSLDTFQRTFFRVVDEIKPKGAAPESMPVGDIPGRTVSGAITAVELSKKGLIGRADAPIYATETLLHELGHSMLSRSSRQQLDAGVDVLEEFQGFLDNGQLENYFRQSHADRADYFLSNPNEAFAQLFSDSVLRRKPTPEGMQGFIDKLKQIAKDILEKILRNPNIDKEVAKKADAMIDLVGGFIDPDAYKAMYSPKPKVKKAADAVITGAKGGVDEAVAAGRAIREAVSDVKEPPKVTWDDIPSVTRKSMKKYADLAEKKDRTKKIFDERKAKEVKVKTSLADEIEELLVEGKTTDEIASELTTGKLTIEGVRINRGIPLAGDESFGAWAESKRLNRGDELTPLQSVGGELLSNPEAFASFRAVEDILRNNPDPSGIIEEISSLTFKNQEEADAAADLATAQLRQLQEASGNNEFIVATYVPIKKNAPEQRVYFVNAHEKLKEMAGEAVRPTLKVQAREAARSPELQRLDEIANGSVFETQEEAMRAADDLNAMVPGDLRSTGAGYVARELDDGSYALQKTNAPDDGLEVFTPDEVPLQDDVASLLDARRTGFPESGMQASRLDEIETAIDSRLAPTPQAVDEVARTPKQMLDDVAARSGAETVLEDDQWLARMAGVPGRAAPKQVAPASKYTPEELNIMGITDDTAYRINIFEETAERLGSTAPRVSVIESAANNLRDTLEARDMPIEEIINDTRRFADMELDGLGLEKATDDEIEYMMSLAGPVIEDAIDKASLAAMKSIKASQSLADELEPIVRESIADGASESDAIRFALDDIVDPETGPGPNYYDNFKGVIKGDPEFPQKQKWQKTLREARKLRNEMGDQFQAPRPAHMAGAAADELEDAATQWREKGVESPYFKKWFGGSKVVDEAGEPQVVYHGTKAHTDEINEFYQNSFFTPSKRRAQDYGDMYMPGDGRVYDVYLKAKNLLELDSQPPRLDYEKIKSEGYDGIVIDPKFGDDEIQYVVFDPEQIKSATGNRGTFDAANPDIRFQAPRSYGDLAFDAAKNAGSMAKSLAGDTKGLAGRTGKAAYDMGNELYGQAKELFDKDIAAAVGVGMDSVSGFIKNSAPVRILTANLDPAVMGGTTELSQEVGRQHYEALEEASYEIQRRLYPIRSKLESHQALNPQKLMESLGDEAKARSAFVENHNAIRRFLEDASPLMNEGKPYELPKELEDLLPVLDDMRSAQNQISQIELDSGLKSPELEDTFARYFTRQMKKFPGGKGSQGNLGKALDPGTPFQVQRLGFLKDIPGGTATINDLSLDDSISGIAKSFDNGKIPKDVRDQLRKKVTETYGGGVPEAKRKDYLFALESGKGREQIDQMIDWLTNLDPRYAELQVPVFKLDPVEDLMVRMEAGLRASAAANFSTSLVARGAIAAQAGGMSMANVASRLANEGMDLQQATRNIVNKMGDKYTKVYGEMQQEATKKIMDDVADVLARTEEAEALADISIPVRMKDSKDTGRIVAINADGTFDIEIPTTPSKVDIPTDVEIELPSETIVNKTERVSKGKRYKNVSPENIEAPIRPRQVLERFSLDPEVAESTFRYIKGFTEPESIKVVEDAIRQVTNMYKSSLTVGFPAFHVRNFISGQYNNFLGNAGDPRYSGPKKYVVPIRDADDFMRGREVKDILEIPIIKDAGITDTKEAMDFLRREIQANKLVSEQGQVNDVVGREMGSFQSTLPTEERSLRDIFFKPPPMPAGARKYDAINPLGARGVLGNEEDTFIAFRWGRQVGQYVEGLNRVAPYIAYLRQGMDSQTAARKVMELQFDYSKMTPTDRKMRLLFPFYTYTKNIIPLTVKQLVERPGGKLAQTIRAGTSAASNEPLPDHIANTAAIPFGARKLPGEGDRSFVTGLGLGFEDALSFAGILGGDMQGTFREVASRTNPMLKFGIEQMTGESTYFDGPGGGRALTDLDPTYGRIRSNIGDFLTGEKTVGRADPIFGSELAENVLANLPTSRIGTTLRTLTDSRKIANPIKMGLNLGTGLKVSDVSEASWDAAMQNKAIEKMQEMGAREFTRRYFPDYIKERMSEGELSEAEGLNEFLNWLAERAKNRKAEREAQELLDSN